MNITAIMTVMHAVIKNIKIVLSAKYTDYKNKVLFGFLIMNCINRLNEIIGIGLTSSFRVYSKLVLNFERKNCCEYRINSLGFYKLYGFLWPLYKKTLCHRDPSYFRFKIFSF